LIRCPDAPNYTIKADFVRTPPSRPPHFGPSGRGVFATGARGSAFFRHLHSSRTRNRTATNRKVVDMEIVQTF
jgi:hypothetical protein